MLLAGGADAPVGHFGFVDDETVGVARFQARSRAGRAVDVSDVATPPADDVVVVVAHPGLEAGWGAGGLDPANERGLGERAQHVLDGLRGDRAQAGADPRGQGVNIGVRVCVHFGQYGDPRASDAQGELAQLLFRGHGLTEPLNLE